jgi:hypothetical protein
MNLYKPFEILFSTIETIWDWMGVGDNYKQVSLVVASFQWFNILTLASLINRELNIYFFVGIYVCLFIFNWIYFNGKRVSRILRCYDEYPKLKKIFFTVVSFLYYIISIVLFYLTTRN